MKILIAYDQNTAASNVINTALARAKVMNASVCLVQSCPDDVKQPEINQLETKLDELSRDIFIKNGIECDTHLLIRGLGPGEDIVEFAKEKQADEIILGIKKKSKVGKLFFGSTAQFIILEAHCPVLSVK